MTKVMDYSLEEPSFLAAIRANPNDDAPLWIYADWLEEKGRLPEADYVRSSTSQGQTVARSAEYKDFKQVWATRSQLTGPMPGVELTDHFKGFPRTALLKSDRTLNRHGAKLAKWTAVNTVRIGAIKSPESFVNESALFNFSGLNLSNNRLNDDFLSSLFSSAKMANIRKLELPGCQLGNLSLRPNLFNRLRLKELNLQFNFFGDQNLSPLINDIESMELETLDLSFNGFQPEFANLLKNRQGFRSLKSLRLRSARCSLAHLKALSTWPTNSALESLEIGSNRFGSKEIQALANNERLSSLKNLSLAHNCTEISNWKAFANSTFANSLVELNLNLGSINPRGVLALINAPSPRFDQLEVLDLSYSELDNDSALALIGAHDRWPKLKRLVLWNSIPNPSLIQRLKKRFGHKVLFD